MATRLRHHHRHSKQAIPDHDQFDTGTHVEADTTTGTDHMPMIGGGDRRGFDGGVSEPPRNPWRRTVGAITIAALLMATACTSDEPSNSDRINDAFRELDDIAGESVDNNLFDRLAPYSEQKTVVQAGATANLELETDIGMVSNETNVGGSHLGTTSSTHRFPGGETYETIAANEYVDARLDELAN